MEDSSPSDTWSRVKKWLHYLGSAVTRAIIEVLMVRAIETLIGTLNGENKSK